MILKNKYFRFFSIVFLLIVSGLYNCNAQTVEKGILDLRGENIKELKEIEFTGEWEFYWQELYSPTDFDSNRIQKEPYFIKVPSVWNSFEINGKKLPKHGFATYKITVLTDSLHEDIALKLGGFGTAVKVFADGKVISKAGIVANNKNDAIPSYKPGVFSFTTKSNKFDIIIQVSNYHYSKGGIWNNMNRIGYANTIQQGWSKTIELTLLMLGAFLIIALYHFGLFLLNKNLKSALYFSIYCVIITIRTIFIDEMYILNLAPNFSWFAVIKIEYLTLAVGTPMFALYVYRVFNNVYSKIILKIFIYTSIILGIIVVLTKTTFYTNYIIVLQLFVMLAVSYSFYVAIKSLQSNRKIALIFLIGFTVLASAIINDILYVNKVINTFSISSVGFMFFVLTQAYMLSVNYLTMFKQTVLLADNLERINQDLEKTVEERTSKIKIQNKTLIKQKSEITNKNNALEQQNEEIKEQRDNLKKQHEIASTHKKHITSSMQYASKIQDAILDLTNEINTVAPSSFVLFKPKDIVSGDFYWFKDIDIFDKNYKIFTAVDGIGHGVPGAFMSMLGASFLNEIVSEFYSEIDAASILNRMREELSKKLQKEEEKEEEIKIAKDGMNMALCVLDYEKMKLQFAGAHNPLFIIRNHNRKTASKIEEYKGDSMPIGIYSKEKKSFANHTIDIHKGDLLYVFTDGYQDQLGGTPTEIFGKKRFTKLLLKVAHLPLSEQKEFLEKTILEWQGNTPQIDDITVICVQV